MRCDKCKVELDPSVTFCSRCGHRVVEEEASTTTAWAAQDASRARAAPLHLEAEPKADAGRTKLIVGGAVVLVGAIAAVVAVAATGGGGDEPARSEPGESPGSTPAPSAPSPQAETWWTPPSGKRVAIEALANAFATTDERDLGAMYDKDLKPVYGAPHLYEEHEPRRLVRDEMSKSITTLRNTLQLSMGFNFLFARFGTEYSSEHEYQLYRAFEIKEVVSVDETKRMREPHADAVFYLAELHRGASYDMLIEGDYEEMGAGLSVTLEHGTWSADNLQGKRKLKINQSGLGLRPKSGDAIFAMTPAQVAKNYETTSEPVPVKLVFKTIPGRGLKEKKLTVAETVVDESIQLSEGEVRRWDLPPGRYRIRTRSKPNGLTVEAAGDVTCSPSLPTGGEHAEVRTLCTIGSYAAFQVTNYTGFGLGPNEDASVLVLKLSK